MIFTLTFYRKAGWLTCFSIFLLVLAGGIVRATGSGMGCPDWPKCFGQYIPPTHESQLPAGYERIFLEKRLAKIDKYVKTLHAFGFHKAANNIKNDPEIRKADKFSVLTTWIEALNRYFGALTGLFALATFISAIQFIKKDIRWFIWSFIGLFAILFNAWMGSVVVATNLMQGPITLHYLAAFIAAALYMYPAMKQGHFSDKKLKPWITLILILVVIQSITGTWSRETVDIIAKNNTLTNSDGHLNHSAMGVLFIVHRYLSVFVLGILLYAIKISKQLKKWLMLLSGVVITQIIAGSINILWVLPPLAQVFHIFAGGIIFGISMYLYFKTIKTINAT